MRLQRKSPQRCLLPSLPAPEMSLLVLRLGAPLMSWSGYRHQLNMGSASPSEALPRKSAIAGLLGAALGQQDTGYGCARELRRLGDMFRLHVRVDSRNPTAEDFQVVGPLPILETPFAERWLRIGTASTARFPSKRAGGNFPTAVSRKDFLSHSEFIVAIEGLPTFIDGWFHAIRKPQFMPYLGRKSCAPTFPFLFGTSHLTSTELFTQLPVVIRHPERRGGSVSFGGYEVTGNYDVHAVTDHAAGYTPPSVFSRECQLAWVKENLDVTP